MLYPEIVLNKNSTLILKKNTRERANVTVVSDFEKQSLELVPLPEVLSPEGPVLVEGVLPLFRVHWKSTDSSDVHPQRRSVSSSKVQSSEPVNVKREHHGKIRTFSDHSEGKRKKDML